MPVSPAEATTGVVSVTISSNGTAQQGPLISVTVRHALHGRSLARLVYSCGDALPDGLTLSDGEFFSPGAAVALQAGYGDAQSPVFTGAVAHHRLKVGQDNEGRVEIECHGEEKPRDAAPLRSSPPVLQVTWGQDLIELDAEVGSLGGHGRMVFQGSALAQPGMLITLACVGERFSGDVLVTAVEHEISDGNWLTKVDFTSAPPGPR